MGTPKLPVMVKMGMAAQKSTLSSARPSPANPSMSISTVSEIQLSVHHLPFDDMNDGWTSAR